MSLKIRRAPRLAAMAVLAALLAAVPAAAGTIVVKPGKLDHFTVTAPPAAVAGESFLIRIEPFDANGNLIVDVPGRKSTFNVVVTGEAVVTPGRINSAEMAGGVTVQVTDRKSETIDFRVVERGADTPLASVKVPVMPNKLDRFVLYAPKEVTAGKVFQVRVVAQDTFGNTKTDLPDISGNVTVNFVGQGGVRLAGKKLPPFRSGELIIDCEPRQVGPVRIFVQELTSHSRGESEAVVVRPSLLDHYIVQAPKTAVAGEEFTVTISAFDVFENLVENYATTGDGVVLVASGDGVLEPSSIPAAAFKKGRAAAKLTYTRAEPIRITAREVNRAQFGGESDQVVVTPGAPDHFLVTTPAEAVAGEDFAIELTALDRFNNRIDDYNLRGIEVLLSTDGSGRLSPAAVSPAAFSKGTAAVKVTYDRAESFTVIAALSEESLRRIIEERSQRAPRAPAPTPARSSDEEAARERALKARREALEQKEREERERARKAAEEARRAAEEARKAAMREKPAPPAVKVPAPSPPAKPPSPPPPAPKRPVPAKPSPAAPPRPQPPAAAKPAPSPAATAPKPSPVRVAKRTVQSLDEVSFVETRGQAMVVLGTSGPVSYNASTGSALSKEWVYVEVFPAQRNKSRVADLIKVDSELVGDIKVDQVDDEKVKVSLEVLPPGISYVVSQQDRAIVVKIIKTE